MSPFAGMEQRKTWPALGCISLLTQNDQGRLSLGVLGQVEKPLPCGGIPPSDGHYYSGPSTELGPRHLAPAFIEIPGKGTPFLITGRWTAFGQRPRNCCPNPRQRCFGGSGAHGRQLGKAIWRRHGVSGNVHWQLSAHTEVPVGTGRGQRSYGSPGSQRQPPSLHSP